MQDKSEIEAHYSKPDPWGYQTRKEDQHRKNMILLACKMHAPERGFVRALDIGAGEGWITKDLPAAMKYGYELSQQAKNRFPENVIAEDVPNRTYDLMILTGVLYPHYDWKLFLHFISQYATDVVVTCNIKDWEIPQIKDELFLAGKLKLKQVKSEEFQYCEYVQKLRVFRKIL